MSRRRQNWTPDQWESLGTKVNQVRAELQSLITESQPVSLARETDKLFKIFNIFESWRANMGDTCCDQTEGYKPCRMFYGEQVTADHIDDSEQTERN